MSSRRLPIRNTSRYAPIRYEATRPYATRLGSRYSKAAQQGDSARMDFLYELLPTLRSELERLGPQDGPGPGQAEMMNVQLFGSYLSGGRIVYDVHRLLSQALAVTDVEDIPCTSLTFPSTNFYIHFGQYPGITNDGFPIEGVFINHLVQEQRLNIDLVPAGFYSDPYFWSLSMGEAPTGVSVDLSQPELSVVLALERSVEATLESNRQIFKQIDEMERQLFEQYGEVVRIPSPVERLDDKLPVLRQTLQLVVNTCFYLTSTDDVVEGWELEAPSDLRYQAANAEKLGTRKTAENTLTNSGYIKVRYVGGNYSASAAAQAIGEAFSSGRIMPTHIRRGHMRRQPYGPERSLRKIVFIPPVVVNPHLADESPGRVYDVHPRSSGE